MAVLKDLIVHGNSRFINGASFNKLKADDLAAEQGYFNKLVAVNGDISNLNVDDLTAQNATVIGLLDVKGELHTNSWTNANIATIDGSFYITPTVSCASGTFAYDGTNITVTAASGSSFGVDSLYTYTTSGTVTTYSSWAQYSRVLLTGEVQLNGSNEWQPLGTIRGQIVSSSTSVIKINNLSDSQGTTPIATLTDLGSTNISGASFRKVKVSLYERASNSTSFYPIGIYMTALGAKGKTFIDIYGGGDAKGSVITNNIDSGAMAKPVLRIGNLGGLPKVANQTPSGWGIYTSNGFFEGAIVAKEGYIGNTGSYWTIGGGTSAGATYMYSGPSTVSATSTAGTYLGTNGFLNVSAAGVTNRPYAQITNGVLTAQGAVIQGALTASSLSTGGRTSSSSAAGTYIDNNGAIYGGNNKFTVTSAGVLTATGAVIEGTIDATSFKARDSNLKTRAEVNLNGLLIYDDTGTSTTYGNLIAQFGSTIQMGNLSIKNNEILFKQTGSYDIFQFNYNDSTCGYCVNNPSLTSTNYNDKRTSITLVHGNNYTVGTRYFICIPIYYATDDTFYTFEYYIFTGGTAYSKTSIVNFNYDGNRTISYSCNSDYYTFAVDAQPITATGASYTLLGLDDSAIASNLKSYGGLSHGSSSVFGYKAAGINNGNAIGNYSLSIGNASYTVGLASVSGGHTSIAYGTYSFAFGDNANTFATNSIALGDHVIANREGQLVFGKYNNIDDQALLVIGNGIAGARSNAFTVDWRGNIMAQGMAGQIIMYAGPIVQSVSNNIITTTAPTGYLLCDGSIVLVADYPELAAVLGSTYGGDGTTTFGLPDFRGRTGVGVGIGTSTTATEHTLGEIAGSERVTLTKTQIPEFTGSMYIRGYKTSSSSSRAALAHGGTGIIDIGAVGSNTANGIMATGVSNLGSNPVTISFGGGESHQNMQPYVGINYIIATGKTN